MKAHLVHTVLPSDVPSGLRHPRHALPHELLDKLPDFECVASDLSPLDHAAQKFPLASKHTSSGRHGLWVERRAI